MSVNLQKIVSQTFLTLKSVAPSAVKQVTYNRISGNTANSYDPETGTTTGTTVTSTTVDAVLTAFKDQDKSVSLEDKINRQYLVGDMKVLVPYSQLPFTPELTDTLTIDGKTWNIIGREVEPTQESLHKFVIRKS